MGLQKVLRARVPNLTAGRIIAMFMVYSIVVSRLWV